MNFTKHDMCAVANSPVALDAFSQFVNSADSKARDSIYRIITEAATYSASQEWVASVAANGGRKEYSNKAKIKHAAKV
ncbi:hypothetical protein [Paraherbaspirillum soli]|uniref:Uncharacterized protein n=1 Tax=Paraherbaspirillum soli TaxID=631222 RepID=A0ABW0MCA6_9BURK